ncbi:TPA: hypothetical protein U2Q49_000812 [Citrobacter koseri]|nr:hypothetical protein [Citrobacter koseri]
MSVKRYDVMSYSLDVDGNLGPFVKYEDYAALEARCAALAAENAGLKAISVKLYNYGYLNGHHHTVEGYFTDIHRSDIDNYHSDIVEEIIDEETPATDALLAEARAQAQSEVIEWLDAEITAIDTMYRGDPSYEHDAYWMKSNVLDVVELARKAFAAQLRQVDAAKPCPHCGGIGTCSEHGCTATDQMLERYRDEHLRKGVQS